VTGSANLRGILDAVGPCMGQRGGRYQRKYCQS
jgi:hypothetical protein